MAFPIFSMLLPSARVDNNHLFKHTFLKNKLYVKKHWTNLSEEGEKILRMVSEERREVRWMEKQFTDKIEGVKSLALLVKEREENGPTNDECSGIL